MLDNIPVEKFIDIPRAIDENGEQRPDIFAFILKKQEDKDKLTKGQLVILHK
jgi:hypothetical protein